MKRNWEGLVSKVLGGRDFRLTVLDHAVVDPHYQRICLDGGGLLASCDLHPTMWIRTIARHLRKDLGVDTQRVVALGYWRAD